MIDTTGPIPMKAVVVLSGGLDSTTLAHHVYDQGFNVYAISFNYGQRHNKELECAAYQAELLNAAHEIVELPFFGTLFAGSESSLITDEEVPEGHYAEDSMKATVVPNRNMIMTSIAIGYAVSIGADRVCLGVHAGDHFIYPDCRPPFFGSLNMAAKIGNEGFLHPMFGIDTPFIDWTKNDIAARAVELNVDISKTWSCYKGGDLHCGKCGTCVERLEAIASTKLDVDPTEYEDPDFWKTVVLDEVPD